VGIIEDVGVDLDRQLAEEARSDERLRILRHGTRLMTQAGNDAVQAYRNGIQALEGKRYRGLPAASSEIRACLVGARRELLLALEVASRRYPWAANPADQPAENAAP
jgi:hypothetical protein